MSKYKQVITINHSKAGSENELALETSLQNKHKHRSIVWSKCVCLADSFLGLLWMGAKRETQAQWELGAFTFTVVAPCYHQ